MNGTWKPQRKARDSSSLSKCAEAQIRVPTGAREACLYRSGPLARSIWTQSRERLSYGCIFVIGQNTMFLVGKRVRRLHQPKSRIKFLLRPHRERPRRRCAAEQRDELAALHD